MDEDYLRDLFSSLPDVSIRRMFGGQGIYSDGIIVAVVLGGELYLKSDDETEAAYEAAGCLRWRYTREGGAPVAMPYYRLPEAAMDDPDEMAAWADRAMTAGRNAAAAKTKAAGRRTIRRSSRSA